jgi:hypothetical protein
MEDKFFLASPGQELGRSEVNLMAEEAALADDRILAELLRLRPLGASPARGILPPSHSGSPITAAAIAVPSGVADATVVVYPFRAVIGPISPGTGIDMLRNSRSAISVGTANMWQYVTFAATAGNNRWDLLYARVDVEIDGPSVTRYIKTSGLAATASALATTKRTTVTLQVLQGTEAATPTRPAVPADSGSSYIIPLAYVLLQHPHTLATAISAAKIFEVAPVLSISRAMGVSTLAPAAGMSSATGIAVANELWTPAAGRPKAFLPSTMTGSESVLISLKEISGTRTIPLGGTGVIDNTRDWRRRLFRLVAQAAAGDFAWNTGGGSGMPFSSGVVAVATGVANSFDTTTYAGTSSLLYSFSSTNWSGVVASGAQVIIWVDSSTGFLMGFVSATDPACNVFVWLEASGQFNNAS